MSSLEAKVIVVAGAGGIGDELARRYASAGASVVLGDLDRDRVRAVAEDIAPSGAALGHELDAASEDSVRAIIDVAMSSFGRLDGLHVNFASFADGVHEDNVLGLPIETFDEVWRVNARGAIFCSKHAIPALLESGGGSVIFTGSSASYIGETSRVAYAMSKEALHPLMRHIARQFGPQGVRANVVAPGVISHDQFEVLVPAEQATSFREATLVKTRLGRPSDIAAMSALLMSDEGSFITGQVINIDGGLTMRA